MAKLDAELRILLSRKQYFDQHPEAGRLDIGPSDPLYVAIKFTGDIGALVAAGLTVGNRVGPIVFGQTTLAGLEALASHPQVVSMSRQRREALQLNDSIPDIHANQVWGRSGDNFTGYTGRGVIVGIIDTGIDFRHKAFRKANGDSRIIKIWDQTLTAIGGIGGETVPGPITHTTIADTQTPLGYGVEYSPKQINDTLTGAANPVRVRHVDADGHGTHVAGIAAGDGSQSGHCHGAHTYVGVATEAELLVVRKWGLTEGDTNAPNTPNSTAIDAVRWIVNEARLAAKPVVINMSFGGFAESMDGSSEISEAIDLLLRHNSVGHAIVVAAGNDADAGFHAAATVPAGPTATLDLKFQLSKKDKKQRTAVVLYSGSNLEARMTSPVGGSDGEIDWIDSTFLPAQSTTANGSGAGAMVTLTVDADRIILAIRPETGGSNKRGTWTLQLRDSGSTATPIDALLLFGSSHDDKSPKWDSHTTSRSTLIREATGFENLAVGSYKVGKKLSDFSARGPTLDAAQRTKPDLAAPGEDITSAAIPKERNCERCCCDCCLDFYITMNGTSMAAPHVAGVVALMLHKNPTLNHNDIRNLLTANTGPKGDSSADQDLGWGAGRLDAKKVMDKVTQINPPVTRAILADDPLADLRAQVLATERGPQLQRLVDRYAAEVWTLIQNNRRVATVWHRCRGPVWVRLAMRAAYAPDLALPSEVEGVSLQEGARRIAAALARYGSPELQRDLRAIAPDVRRLTGGVSLTQLIDDLGNHGSPMPEAAGARA
jgi:subtilisin family serine protease